MDHEAFSKETINSLRESPYVEGITSMSIRFTHEFKIMASQAISLNMSNRQKNDKIKGLLKGIGIDPQLLPPNQISTIRQLATNLIKDAYQMRKEEMQNTESRRIKRLEHEVTYLKQEQEFIKKILSAAVKNDN